MIAVISCNKYAVKTLKLADFGDNDPAKWVDKLPPCECPICGPLSHTELSWRGYFNIHSRHETVDEATEAAWKLYDADPNSFKPEMPPRLETA